MLSRALIVLVLAIAGCSHPPGGRPVLWRDPGNVDAFEFTYGVHGPGYAPQPPFRFMREDLRGTSPKFFASDAGGRLWRVKGGLEVRAESFCTRLASALGYYGEPTFFVPSGRVNDLAPLKRPGGFVQPNGAFTYASFERFEPELRFLDREAWNWSGNPFDGTPELAGLKILVMLVSDWDNKDARNSIRGSNLGIVEQNTAHGRNWIYFVDDWGQSLGRWGTSYTGTSTFDCAAFTAQGREFVTGVQDGQVRFGYLGQHSDIRNGIRVSDVSWLMRYLGRITDDQIKAGLTASGAFPSEITCFTTALRERIEQLRRAASSTSK